MGGCSSKCLNRRGSEEAGAAFPEPAGFQPLPGEAPAGGVEEPGEEAPVEDVEEPREGAPVEGVEELEEEAPVELAEEPGEEAPVEDVEEPRVGAPVEGVEELEEEAPVGATEQLDQCMVPNDKLSSPDGNDSYQTGAQHQERKIEQDIINGTVWIVGPGLRGDKYSSAADKHSSAADKAQGKFQELLQMSKVGTLQYETENDNVNKFIIECTKAFKDLSSEDETERMELLVGYLKRQSTLDELETYPRQPSSVGDVVDDVILNVTKSWEEASKIVLQKKSKAKIFEYLRGLCNTIGEGCLIAKVSQSDILYIYNEIKSNWETGENWESQIKDTLKMGISELVNGQSDDEKQLSDLFVDHTSVYAVGRVGDLLGHSLESGFLMFTTQWEIRDQFKNLKKVDTDRLLTTIDEEKRSVNLEVLQTLAEDENTTKSSSGSQPTTIWNLNDANITLPVIKRRDQSGLNLIENILVHEPTDEETLDKITIRVNSELITDAIVHLTLSGYKAVTIEPLIARISQNDIMTILKSLVSPQCRLSNKGSKIDLKMSLEDNSWPLPEEVLKQLLNKLEHPDALESFLTKQNSDALHEILKADMLRDYITTKLSLPEQYLNVLNSVKFNNRQYVHPYGQQMPENRRYRSYPYWKVLQPLEDGMRTLFQQKSFLSLEPKDQTKAFLLYNNCEDELYNLPDNTIPADFDHLDLKSGIFFYLAHTSSHPTKSWANVIQWTHRFQDVCILGNTSQTAPTQLPRCCDKKKLNIIERAVFWMCSCIATSQLTKKNLLESALTPSAGKFSRYILRFIACADEKIISRYTENTDKLLSEVCSQYDVSELRKLISACIDGDGSDILSILLNQVAHQGKFNEVCSAGEESSPLVEAIRCKSKQSFNTIITFCKKTENKHMTIGLIAQMVEALPSAVQANDPEYVKILLSTVIANKSFKAVHKALLETHLLLKTIKGRDSSTLEVILQFYSDNLEQYIELLTHDTSDVRSFRTPTPKPQTPNSEPQSPIPKPQSSIPKPQSPLHCAAEKPNSVYMDILLRRLKGHAGTIHHLCMKHASGRNVLQTAICNRSGAFQSIMKSYTNEQELLLELVENQDEQGNSSLHVAAVGPTTIYLNVLLARCGKSKKLNQILSIENKEDFTALSVASKNQEFTSWEKYQFVKQMMPFGK